MNAHQDEFFAVAVPQQPAAPSRTEDLLRALSVREQIEADIAAEEKASAAAAIRREIAAAAFQARRVRLDVPVSLVAEFARCADHYYTTAAEAEEISDQDRAFAFSAEGGYAALCKERTGKRLPDDVLIKNSRAAAELLGMSIKIAEKMRGAGFECMRETPFEQRRYFLHSHEWEDLPFFRRSCFIPYVAQQLRAPMLAALEHWLSRHLFARFWTFTSGIRVQMSLVRDRHNWLCAKLDDLNEQPFMKEAGVRMVFANTELGTPEIDSHGNAIDGGEIERDQDGQLYFHLHAHAVVELAHGFIPPEKWSKLVAKVGAFWPYHWDEGGAIRNARECCKYVTKPGEMLKLSGEELVALQKQLFRAKLVRPMGSLAAEIAQREKDGKRLVRKSTPDGRVYVSVRNWNRHARRTRSEQAQDAAQKLTPAVARRAVWITSRGVPRFGKSGIAEPVVTVMCKRGSWDENAVRTHPLVAPIIGATARAYFRSVGEKLLGISVHTRTPTPCTKPATAESWRESGQRKAPMGAQRSGF